MSLASRHLHTIARLAMVAALALALLPTVARALQPVAAAPVWASVCSSTATPDLTHALDACAHCVVAALPVLPPAPAKLPAATPGGHVAAPIVAQGLAGGAAWGAAQARAPPAA
ncbi:MAG: hypothetical protein H6933_20190 [Burkholderiaceae bacterium]|nr:hypothetical protein [Rhodoferax sp.]MCP5287217.1 hypothetical protein [Burkholderiaceae bacterium]